MKEYASTNIRNIALVGHGKSGKTSIAEDCLFNTGAIKRRGSIADGTMASDYEPEETRRELSIQTSLLACEWLDHKLNILDTPGYPDFVGEVKSALQAADSALVVISAVSGIEVETEKVWRYAEALDLPRAFFVNKIDREHADFQNVVNELRLRFGTGVVPIQLPVGKEAAFQGVVDLLAMTVRIKERDKNNCVALDEIPEYMKDEVEEARQTLIEGVAEINNTLLEKYIEGETLDEREVAEALIEGIETGKIFPVLCGSASLNVGMHALLNDMVEYLPAPTDRTVVGTLPGGEELVERTPGDPFSAQVFKTIVDPFVGRLSFIRIFSGEMKSDASYWNISTQQMERVSTLYTMQGKKQIAVAKAHGGDIVVAAKLQNTRTSDTLVAKEALLSYDAIEFPMPMLAQAVYVKKKGEEDKVFAALAKECEEDPSLKLEKDAETKETLIRGIGEVHLEVLQERMKRKFGIEAIFAEPRIAYRETIRKSVKAEGKHKKQSGGHGQYGHVMLEISPRDAGTGNEFTENIFGGSVPRQYVPAVEKGTAETLAAGILAGYPVVDVRVNLYDGSYHTVDSSEVAFKTATAIALRKGIMEASPVLLEPIYEMCVQAPEYYMGDVMGQLNAKRARILGMEMISKDTSEVRAQVPLAALHKYATELRSLTQGRGTYTLRFCHYEEVPEKTARQLIEAARERKEK